MADTNETIANIYLTLWADEIADRIEAAIKRERGDAAKWRAASGMGPGAWAALPPVAQKGRIVTRGKSPRSGDTSTAARTGGPLGSARVIERLKT